MKESFEDIAAQFNAECNGLKNYWSLTEIAGQKSYLSINNIPCIRITMPTSAYFDTRFPSLENISFVLLVFTLEKEKENLLNDPFLKKNPEWTSLLRTGNVALIAFNCKKGITDIRYNNLDNGVSFIKPSNRVLKAVCKDVYAHYLKYFLRKEDLINLKERMELGWFKERGLPFYFGVETLSGEMEHPPLEEIKSLLSATSYKTTITLFSYTLFSVLKFFYPFYPSRMSSQEPFMSVIKKSESIICLCANGKSAQSWSKVFCGMFFQPCGATEINYAKMCKHVHDGVVIYTKNSKRTIQERQLLELLVRDSSAVFINCGLSSNPAHINLEVNEGISNCEEQKLSESGAWIVKDFILWIQKHYEKEYEKVIEELIVPKITKAFISQCLNLQEFCSKRHYLNYDGYAKDTLNTFISDSYKNAAKGIKDKFERIKKEQKRQILPKEAFEIVMYSFCQGAPNFEKNYHLYKKIKSKKYAYTERGYEEFVKKVKRTRARIKRLVPNASEIKSVRNEEFIPSDIAECCADFVMESRKIFWHEISQIMLMRQEYKRAKEELHRSSYASVQYKQHAYLLSAFRVFLDYLKYRFPGEHAWLCDLDQHAVQIFQSPYSDDTKKALELFSLYLSYLLEENKIVPVRTEQQSGCAGWYDAKKELLYLPHADYFARFKEYCIKEQGVHPFSISEDIWKRALINGGYILQMKNGKNTDYFRTDFRIIVAPIQDENGRKESVAKINITALSSSQHPLSIEAQKALEQLGLEKTRRRRSKYSRT